MDVDYSRILYPNGREIVCFVMGWTTFELTEGQVRLGSQRQYADVDSQGRIHTNGALSVAGDFFSPFSLNN
jgi:hypothetical protein